MIFARLLMSRTAKRRMGWLQHAAPLSCDILRPRERPFCRSIRQPSIGYLKHQSDARLAPAGQPLRRWHSPLRS
jgi:hypothetical protein